MASTHNVLVRAIGKTGRPFGCTATPRSRSRAGPLLCPRTRWRRCGAPQVASGPLWVDEPTIRAQSL